MGRKKMENKRQMSETFRLGVVLALAGGFMDAYSYICREQVFANAQTGNMLLLGINLSRGNFNMAFHYFCPVLAFTVGIILAELVRHKGKRVSLFHWRQIAVLMEAVILFAVGFIPQERNLLANSLTSLACGIQVESFRKIHGNGIATTMCIGNLRSGTQHMYDYFFRRQKESWKKGMLYYGIIFCFIAGAVIGGAVIGIFAEKSILICSGILFVAFLFMFIEEVQKR